MSYIVTAQGGLVEMSFEDAKIRATKLARHHGRPFTVYRVIVAYGVAPDTMPDPTPGPTGVPEVAEAKAA